MKCDDAQSRLEYDHCKILLVLPLILARKANLAVWLFVWIDVPVSAIFVKELFSSH